jgi:preprotein translocase subunit SecG
MLIALTVVFFIVSVILTLIILLQPGSEGGMGFLGGGGSQSAFGTKTGTVMTRFTTILAALFMLVSFVLGYLNSRQGKIGTEELKNIKKTVEQLPGETPTMGSGSEDIGVDISDTNK